MSNRTFLGLGGEAQRDNEPHRHDYIRRDQMSMYPAIQEQQTDWRVALAKVSAIPFVIIVLWGMLFINRWAACRHGVDLYCAISEPLPFFFPLFLVAALAAYGTWLWTKAWSRNRVETRRASLIPDAYSNPVSVDMLQNMTYQQYAAMFNARQHAEIQMAPHKQLPAGLDAYSPSYHYSNKNEAGDSAIDGDGDPLEIVPIDEWLPWLTDEMVPHLLLCGKTRSGKSTLADVVLKFRADRGDQIAILDPHWSTQDKYGNKKWGGIPPVAKRTSEFEPILRALKAEYEDRISRMQLPANDPKFVPESDFDPITIVIDEAPEVVGELGGRSEVWRDTVKVFGSGGAKVNIYVILLSQSPNIEDVGMNKKMRENFCAIALANLTKPFLYEYEGDKERRAGLINLLRQHSISLTPPQLPAVAEYNGMVSVLSRDGILDYRKTTIYADVWSGVATGVVRNNANVLDSSLLHATPHRTPSGDPVLARLVALKRAGSSRRKVRATYPDLEFDDALWSQACAIAGQQSP